MALINCPECGRERVSDSAINCPECGFGVQNYFDAEKKRAEEEAAAKEKADKELAEKKEKISKLKEEYRIEIEKIKNMLPPEKPKIRVDFYDNTFVLSVVLWLIACVCLVLALTISWFFVASIVFAVIGSFTLYNYCKIERELHCSITEDWDKVKNEKIALLKEEYSKKADCVIKYGNIENTQKPPVVVKETHIPKCPICGSERIERLTVFDRFFSILFFGLSSAKIGKQFECRDCECRW